MAKSLADEYGIGYPLFAFSHCRDVVAEVSRRGGFGVLGGIGGAVEELEGDLRWLDENTGGTPYGVDTIMPARRVAATGDPQAAAVELLAKVPLEHREYARQIVKEHGIEPRPLDDSASTYFVMGNEDAYRRAIDISCKHPLVGLFVGALGTPPQDVIDQLHTAGIKVGALAGTSRHAVKHVEDGVDIIIAQGTEAGGHTGDIGTMVLVPDVVDAVGSTPVLAAGGIGTGRQMAAAMALGAQGAWTGSIWLTVSEAATPPHGIKEMLEAKSTDTVRSRSLSGKTIRQLRSPWSEAWARPDAPPTLDMPLQGLLLPDALPSGGLPVHGYVESKGLTKAIVGQIVGRMNEVRSTRAVIDELLGEYLETLDRMGALLAAAVE